jgi:hypothetical protein
MNASKRFWLVPAESVVRVGERVVHLGEEPVAELAAELELQRVVVGESAIDDGVRRVDAGVPCGKKYCRACVRRPAAQVRDVEVGEAADRALLDVRAQPWRWPADRTRQVEDVSGWLPGPAYAGSNAPPAATERYPFWRARRKSLRKSWGSAIWL